MKSIFANLNRMNLLKLTSGFFCVLSLANCQLKKVSTLNSILKDIQVEEINVISYSQTQVNVQLKINLSEHLLNAQNIYRVYTNSSCTGIDLAHGNALQLKQDGTIIQVPMNEKTDLYLSTSIDESCTYLTNYQFERITPKPPVFTQTMPGSPSRTSFEPAVLGQAMPLTTVSLYTDSNCVDLLNSGSSDAFKTGIQVFLTANSQTKIYGQIEDALNQKSACVELTTYSHFSTGPDPATFVSITPLSPSHVTDMPTIQVQLPTDAVKIMIFSDSKCSTQLKELNKEEIPENGILIKTNENVLMPIYAIVLNDQSEPSFCSFLTNYLYDTQPPDVPQFVNIDPLSPTRLTIYPVIYGLATNDTAVVKFYNSPVCINPIGSGSKYQFENSGIQVGVNMNAWTTIYAANFDSAGNQSRCVLMTNYYHNVIPPNPPIFGDTNPVTYNNQSSTPLITGDASETTVSLDFYSDEQCTQNIGTGTSEQFNTTGIQLATPFVQNSVNMTNIFATATDAEGNISTCTFMVMYAYSTAKAPIPVFVNTYPASPSRYTASPTIFATAPNIVSKIYLYSDNICSSLYGVAPRNVMTTQGLTVNLQTNKTTNIYAKSLDLFGNESDCILLTSFTHDNILPLAPSFISTTPLSPNNQSINPVLKGQVTTSIVGKPLVTNKIYLYDNLLCMTRIGSGSPDEFENAGIMASVYANAITGIYAQSGDAAGNLSPCTLMVNYTHDTNPPGDPVNLVFSPQSPTFSRKILVKGSFGLNYDIVATQTVNFYRDQGCTQIFATMPASVYTTAGDILIVDRNTTTTLYGQSVDVVGNKSGCVNVMNHVQSDLGPNNLNVSLNPDGSVYLQWTPDSSASPSPTYIVKRAIQSGGPYSVLSWSNLGSNFTDYNVTDGKTYYYVVASTNNTGVSNNSTEVSVTINANGALSPTTLTATSAVGAVFLSWNTSANNMYYRVYRGTQHGGPYTMLVDDLQSGGYTDNSVADDMDYFYVVSGGNTAGESFQSNEVSIHTRGNPDPPKNLVITPSKTICNGLPGVILSWTGSQFSSYYVVQRSVNAGNENDFATTNSTMYIDCQLSFSPLSLYYFYVVRSVWGSTPYILYSNESNVVSLSNTDGPTVTAYPGNNQVVLNWTAVTNADSYNIYRATKSGWPQEYTLIQGDLASMTYTDTNVSNANNYYYVVQAEFINNRVGIPSFEVSATPSSMPTSPSSLTIVQDSTTNYPNLRWTNSSYANFYNIYRSTSAGSGYSLVGTSVTNSFTDGTIVNSGKYYYYVTCQWGNSQTSSTNVVSYAFGSPTLTLGAVTSTSIAMSWTTVSGATSYNIYRSTNPNSGFTLIGNQTSTSFSNTTSSPGSYPASTGNGYYYYIQAVFSGGTNGPSSNKISSSLQSTPLTPYGVAVTSVTNSSVKLSWAAVSGSNGYTIYRSTNSTSGFTSIGTTASTVTSFSANSGMSQGSTYYFKVATTSCTTSCQSSAVSTTLYGDPTAPSGTPGNSNISISWSGVSGATSYNIWRSTDAVNYTKIVNSATNPTTDSGVTNGTGYYYRIEAVFPTYNKMSTDSLPIVPGISPQSPKNLFLVSNTTGTDVTFSWGAVSGSYILYNIYYSSTSSTGPWNSVVSASNSNYNLTGLTSNTQYWVKVTASSGTIESADSNVITFVTLPSPAIPNVSNLNNQLNLNWAPISGASTYKIFRSSDKVIYTQIASGLTNTNYIDATVNANNTYYYYYQAFDVNGVEYAPSLIAGPINLVNPMEPTKLTAEVKSINSVKLYWVESNSQQVINYNIYRSAVSGGPYTLINSVSNSVCANSTCQYLDSAAAANTNYYYVITSADNYNFESINSNEASVRTIPGATNISGVALNNQLQISWDQVSGAQTYRLKRSNSPGGPYSTVYSGSNLSFIDLNIVNNVIYYFVVEAIYSDSSTGAFSNEISLTATKLLNLEIPIELIDEGISSDITDVIYQRSMTTISPDYYDGTLSYYWDVVYTNTGSTSGTIKLIDSADSDMASIVLPVNGSSKTRISQSVSLHNVNDRYRLKILATANSEEIKIYSSKIRIVQTGASKTRIYIPMLNTSVAPNIGDLYAPIFMTSNNTLDVPGNAYRFVRDLSKFSQIYKFNGFELESLVSSSNSTIGIVALKNLSTNKIVTGSDTIVDNQDEIKMVNAIFSNGNSEFATPVNDMTNYSTTIQCTDNCDQGYVALYKSGLWINIDNLSKAEIPFRISNTEIISNVGIDVPLVGDRFEYDPSHFTNPVAQFKVNAIASADGPLSVSLIDAGTSDSDANSTNVVSNTNLNFSGTAYQSNQSTSVSLQANHRYYCSSQTTGNDARVIQAIVLINISQ